jgi:hypothetical protein
MKLIGLISFYDEPRDTLLSCLASLAHCGIEHVVAVDGAYALYPGGTAESPAEQQAAIVMACRDLGMGVTLHVPRAVWAGNEPQKRSFLFYLGLVHADPGDWFMVMDADQTIVRIPDNFMDRLRTADEEVATVTFHDEDALYTRRILFAAQPIYVRGNHWTYVTMDDRFLWADQAIEQEPSLNLTDFVVLHRPRRRPDERLMAKKDYYDVRDESGAELFQCRECENGRATKRMPKNWHRQKALIRADWTEACDECAEKLERANHIRLRMLGLNPDRVVPRTVLTSDNDPNLAS